jgi:steroid delta-isomerase-like uncharacterized protein
LNEHAGKAATRRFIDLAWNQGRLDEARPLLAPDFANHTPTNPKETRDEFLARIGSFRAAFPDLTLTVEEMLADGDRVITRWRIDGTHLGVFRDVPPTKRRVRVTGIAIDVVIDGVRVEGWALMDLAGLMAQLR